LTGLKMDVSWLARKLSGLAAETQGEEMHSRLSQMTQLLDDTIVATKQLSTELRPGVLDKLGLAAAIEWQCEEFSKRKGISCVYRLPDEQLRLTAEEATTLFRILQEALTNVGRHSGADNAFVELTVTGSSATLIVRDFGKGISEAEATAPTSLGLLGMRERAQMLGGTLEVESQTGVGTIIRTTIPVGT
jgi:signal transduction histidine kinase